ncbi:TEL2-interacting protein 1, partial [Blyttiomyces sp. JEL0837]
LGQVGLAPAFVQALCMDPMEDALNKIVFDEDVQRLFVKIRPLCVEILVPAKYTLSVEGRSPIFRLTQRLRCTANPEDAPLGSSVRALIGYIMFPLVSVMRMEMQAPFRILEESIECLHCLIESVDFVPLPSFLELAIGLPMLVTKGGITRNVAAEKRNLPDEIKLVAVKCLSTMPLKSRPTQKQQQIEVREGDVLEEFRKPARLGMLSNVIGTLLDAAENEKNLSLRVEALNAIRGWIEWINEPSIIRKIFPGLLSTLGKVIISNPSGSHKLLVAAMECMESSIIAVQPVNVEQASERANVLRWQSLSEGVSKSGSESRTASVDQWFEETGPKIHAILTRTFAEKNHEQWKTRLAFLKFAYRLLTTSRLYLNLSLSLILETLISFVEDDMPQVREKCQMYIAEIAVNCKEDFELMDLVKTKFDAVLKSIPAALGGIDEQKKTDVLKVAAGLIHLLQESATSIISLSLEQFCSDLFNVLRFTSMDLKLVEERTTQEVATDAYSSSLATFPSKKFQTIHDPQTSEYLSHVLRLLAVYGDDQVLFNTFLGLLLDDGNSNAGLLFVLNEFCRGMNERSQYVQRSNDGGKKRQKALKRGIKNMVKIYLEHSAKRRAVVNSQQRAGHGKDLEVKGTLVIEDCLVLEGIANAACVLKADFQPLLIDTMYYLFSKLGDSNRAVSETAYLSLQTISLECGYSGSVQTLLVENVDYIVNEVSLGLKDIQESTAVLQVLTAAIRVAGNRIINLLDDSFESLMDAIDRINFQNMDITYRIFRVLEVLATVLNAEAPVASSNLIENDTSSQHNWQSVSFQMKEFKLLYGKLDDPLSSVNLDDSDVNSKPEEQVEDMPPREQANDAEAMDDKQDAKPKLSRSEQMSDKIITKCQHYIASDEPQFTCLVLRVLALSMPCLASQSRTLLPAIHKVWPIIVGQLQRQTHYIVLEALETIAIIAKVTKDFVMKRFVDDLVPKFEFLMKTFRFDHDDTNITKSLQMTARKNAASSSPMATDSFSHEIRSRILKSTFKTTATMIDAIPFLQPKDLLRILKPTWAFLHA